VADATCNGNLRRTLQDLSNLCRSLVVRLLRWNASTRSPLGEKQGPYKMAAPHDERPARWIRMLKSLTVLTAPQGRP
jgi:hypothetical protein